jgi:hypothetical protein
MESIRAYIKLISDNKIYKILVIREMHEEPSNYHVHRRHKRSAVQKKNRSKKASIALLILK